MKYVFVENKFSKTYFSFVMFFEMLGNPHVYSNSSAVEYILSQIVKTK